MTYFGARHEPWSRSATWAASGYPNLDAAAMMRRSVLEVLRSNKRRTEELCQIIHVISEIVNQSLFRRFTAELLCCRSEEALDNSGESVNGTNSMSRVSSLKCQVERS